MNGKVTVRQQSEPAAGVSRCAKWMISGRERAAMSRAGAPDTAHRRVALRLNQGGTAKDFAPALVQGLIFF